MTQQLGGNVEDWLICLLLTILVSFALQCARQGFALGLAAIVGTIPSVNVESVMKLIEDELRVTVKMEGQVW